VERSEAARLLGSLPKGKRHERVCPVCGTAFTSTARGVYCNPLCAAKAQTRRKTTARRARSIEDTTVRRLVE
jgi:tRNA(Ile2) C34 agmatinyltransferase TiaS